MNNEKNRLQNSIIEMNSNAECASSTADTAMNQTKQSTETVEVLYQKLGERWYAFSLVGDDVFYGPVSAEEVEAARTGKTISKPDQANPGQGIDRTGTA